MSSTAAPETPIAGCSVFALHLLGLTASRERSFSALGPELPLNYSSFSPPPTPPRASTSMALAGGPGLAVGILAGTSSIIFMDASNAALSCFIAFSTELNLLDTAPICLVTALICSVTAPICSDMEERSCPTSSPASLPMLQPCVPPWSRCFELNICWRHFVEDGHNLFVQLDHPSDFTKAPFTGSKGFREDGNTYVGAFDSLEDSFNLIADGELIVVSENSDPCPVHEIVEDVSKSLPSIGAPKAQEHFIVSSRCLPVHLHLFLWRAQFDRNVKSDLNKTPGPRCHYKFIYYNP